MQTKPIMVIGRHLLEGKLVMLPHPIAVLEKRQLQSRQSEATNQIESTVKKSEALEDDMMSSQLNLPKESSTTYDIATILTRKIVFSKRPLFADVMT